MGTAVSEDLVIPEGAVRTYEQNSDNDVMCALLLGDYRVSEYEPSVVNHGEVHLGNSIDFPAATLFHFSSGFFWDSASFDNYGLIKAVDRSALDVTAIHAGTWGPDLYNAGTIFAAAEDRASCLQTWDNTLHVTNARTGVFRAEASEVAIALRFANGHGIIVDDDVYGGGSFTNHGRIIARSTGNGETGRWEEAIGLHIGNGGGGDTLAIVNTGLIECSDTDPATEHSDAIHLNGDHGGTITNSGTIRGDYAIFEQDGGNRSSYDLTVRNSGTIEGRVFLITGHDVLENTGEIVGDVELGAGNDVYDGGLGEIAGAVSGGEGADRLIGGAGTEHFLGGDGNDQLAGGSGDDALDGGAGSDRVSYAGAVAGVAVRLALAGAQDTGGAGTDTLTSVESLTGSSFNDSLVGTAAANSLSGGAGTDRLKGNDGDDELHGGAGNDLLDGGAGSDMASYADAVAGVALRLAVSGAQDTGGAGIDTLTSIEALTGSAFADDLTGTGAANVLNGGAGADNLTGGRGNDTYVIDNVGDAISEAGAAGGIDSVSSAISYTLGADLENLALTGSSAINGSGNILANSISGNNGANRLSGAAGADTMHGAGGNDRLDGGQGHDRIAGGTGFDVLVGGTGLDVFSFDAKLGRGRIANVDTIVDFSAADDTIWLDQDVFAGIANTGRLADAAFQGGPRALDATDRILYDSDTGKILYDADGRGGERAVLFANVAPGTDLTASDFIIGA